MEFVARTAQSSAGNLIRAEIDGLRNARGEVRCLLFRGEDGFPSDASKALRRAVAKIVDGAAACEFPYSTDLGVHDIHLNQGDPPGQFQHLDGIWQDGGTIIQP